MMTKREWNKWSKVNAPTFAKAGLTARQVAVLAEAYDSFQSGKEGGRLVMPILLPGGIPVEYDSEEVSELEDRGLIRREISEYGSRSIMITPKGCDILNEIFAEIENNAPAEFLMRDDAKEGES